MKELQFTEIYNGHWGCPAPAQPKWIGCRRIILDVLKYGIYGFSIAVTIWLVASFINVNTHNLSDQDYSKWNAFNMIADNAKEEELDNTDWAELEAVEHEYE